MTLIHCPSCRRHVRPRERSCPFCAVQLASSIAPLPIAFGLFAGLALAACTGDNETDGGGEDYAGPPGESGSPETTGEDDGSDGGSTGGDTADGDTTGDESDSGSDSGSGSSSETGSTSTQGMATDEGGEDYAGAPAPDDDFPL